MDKAARRRWHNMLVTALADQELGADEKAYLEEMRQDLGLSQEDARDVAAAQGGNGSGIQLAGSPEERLDQFRDILSVVLADGMVDPREGKLIKAVASHLKIGEGQLQILMEECREKAVIAADATTPVKETVGTIHKKTGIELISVPKSTFRFGDMGVGSCLESKACDAFQIARFPVTLEQWSRFETETSHQGRAIYEDEFYEDPAQPVVGVSHGDALAFCEWAGLRLPSEVEWERAARGTDGRKYPWGNDYPDTIFAHFGQSLFDSNKKTTIPIGQRPAGVSPAGCQDMAGNVDEWCADPDVAREDFFAIRGGNWLSAPYALNVFYHNFRERTFRAETLGLRVAADA